MRRLVELGGALLAVAAGGAVHTEARADPAAPQLSPGPARREDAQRLGEQLQAVEPAAPRSLPPLPPLPPEPPPAAAPSRSGALGIVGVTLLCIAGGTALSAAALVDSGADSGLQTGLLVTAAVSAAAGATLVLWQRSDHRSVQAMPAVAPHAVGVAIAGHL